MTAVTPERGEALARIDAAVKRRRAGCRDDAQHKWRSQRGDRDQYEREAAEHACVSSLSLLDLEALIAAARPAPSPATDGVVRVLRRLFNVCLASDFNEHWDEYQEARSLLTKLEARG